MGSIIELTPKRPEQIRRLAGYVLDWRDCVGCHRDFIVSVPSAARNSALVVDIPCPQCHRYDVEVLVAWSREPIYIEPIERSRAEWAERDRQRRRRMWK